MIYLNIYPTDFGNILFMVLNGLNLSIKYNIKLYIIDYEQVRNDRPYFKNYDIFKSLETVKLNNIDNNIINIKEQTEFHYDEIILNPNKNYIISGYFQSYKYFYDNIDKIKKILFMNSIMKYKESIEYFDSITEVNKKNIMIHIRRGDYLIYNIYTLEPEHFLKSLDTFFINNNREDYNIYLFTENIDEVKEWNFYKKYSPKYIDENDPEKIFLLMTLFDHYIISNSSLSLSAYYLRNNKNASITMPPIWWNDTYFNCNDMILPKVNHIDVLPKLENTYIINLDYRIDRKYNSIKNVKKISNKIEIFDAIKDKFGAIGCTKSHIEILKKAIELNLDYVFICEDDIKIENSRYVLNGINNIMNNFNWDVIIVAGVFLNETNTLNKFVNKTTDVQTTTGYIVNKNFMKILLNNFQEGLDNLINKNNPQMYAIDMYWKKLQKEYNFYCLNKKYVYQEQSYSNVENLYTNYKNVFNIQPLNFNEYIFDIPIININNINDIININDFYKDYEYIIINCNKYYTIIPDEFIKFTKNELVNNNYELIQLENYYEINEFNRSIRDSNILSKLIWTKCNSYLLKRNLLKRILLNPNEYIINNQFNYNNIKFCKLNKPIILQPQDMLWLEYYNIINSFDKIYILHLNKDIFRLNNCIEMCNIFNINPKDCIWDGIIGINLPDNKDLLNNKIINFDLRVGEKGCNLSQQYMLEDAQKNNYNKILILEDDCIFNIDYFNILYNLTKYDKYDLLNINILIADENQELLYKNKVIKNSYKNFDLVQFKNNVDFGGFSCTILTFNSINEYLKLNKPIKKISDCLLCDMICNNDNRYVILDKNNNSLTNVINRGYSNTFNLLNKINNINIPLIKTLNKLQILEYKKKFNININLSCTEKCMEYYSDIINFIHNNYKKNNEIINQDNYDIFIMTDGDNFEEYNYIKEKKLIKEEYLLKILISGEPTNIDYNFFDIIIGSSIKKNNHIIIPIPFMLLSLNERRLLNKIYDFNFYNKKMCAFMYSVDYQHRVNIFNEFSKKIKVDSLGKSCNNVNIDNTRNIYNESETYNDIAVKIYSEYKFVLAIENTIKDLYFTEKLINPILANSIPIYYGSNTAFEIINKKRVIWFDDFESIDKLTNYIIELSNDEEKYKKIINEKVFVRDDITFNNYNEFINKQINTFMGFDKRIYIETDCINNYDNSVLIKDLSKHELCDFINSNDKICNFNKYDKI